VKMEDAILYASSIQTYKTDIIFTELKFSYSSSSTTYFGRIGTTSGVIAKTVSLYYYNLFILMCVLIHLLDASSHFVPSQHKSIFSI
jgi:hypothetical protein